MKNVERLNNLGIEAIDFEAPTGEIEKARFRLTAMHIGLIGLALLTLLFLLFITLAKSIQVSTFATELEDQTARTPISAEIKLGTLLKLPIGNRFLVLPGAHLVSASAEGFQSLEQSIEVESDRNQNFDLVLERLPGLIQINLQPSIKAAVKIDGETVADLPGVIEDIAAGRHTLEVDADLYRTATESILVNGQGITESIDINLEPAWAVVSLDSVPRGAQVAIDGVPSGQTPIQVKVEEGSHQLTIEAPKYKAFEQDFTVFAQQDIEVPAVELVPADGLLDIETQPDSAAIIVNGEYQGVSPLQLALTPDTPQTVQVYKAGYKLSEQQVVLEAAEQANKRVELAQDATAVTFSIVPNDAQLIIDGVNRGTGSKTVSLNTLPHRIVVRKAGYVPYSNTLIPTKASSQVVSIKLLTKEQQFWANVPDSYETAAGQKMKLFKNPGIVQMGSSRREVGRRSNESMYKARLTKPFFVSLHEVTNKQFRAFKPSHNSGNYKRKSLDSNKHPVANVSWQEAAKYCNWLSIKEGLDPFYTTKSGFVSGQHGWANGYRLLTEVEWAWLARNKQGDVLTYPWGSNPQPPKKAIANFADVNAAEFIAFTLADYDDGHKASSPIGRFPSNHRGLFDIDGNASEWVNDWYTANSDKQNEAPAVTDPQGPKEGEFHVIRGASWARGHLPQLRLAYRDFGAKGKHDVSFRIARYVGEPK